MSHKKLGITKDVMATKVIPFLMPLSIENGLNLNQVVFKHMYLTSIQGRLNNWACSV